MIWITTQDRSKLDFRWNKNKGKKIKACLTFNLEMENQQLEQKKDNSEINPMDGTENDGKVEMSDLIKALTSSMRAMNNRTLQTWDITSKNQSIKAHIKSAENMARRFNWSEKETASELMLSLRGEAKI